MNTISATQLKNKIADVLDEVRFNGTVTIIERHGKPVAKIVPMNADLPNAKSLKSELVKFAGMWKGTELDDDELWKDVLKRNSRRKSINLEKALKETFGILPDFPDVTSFRRSRQKPLHL